MLYFLLYTQLYKHISPLRVFGYTTSRTAFASLTALFLCIALGPWLINKLRYFQIGQYIREEGPQVASEEGRHSHHGRRPHHHLDRRPHAALGRPQQPLRVDCHTHAPCLRLDRISGRLRQDHQTAQPRPQRQAQAALPVHRGILLRRRAALHAHLGRFQYRDEFPVHQDFQTVAADAAADGQSVDLRARRRALLHLRGPGGGLHVQRGQSHRRPRRPRHRPDGDRRRRPHRSHLRRRPQSSLPSISNSRAIRAPPNSPSFAAP